LKHFRQYLVARTAEEAIGLRRSVGPKAMYIAGGTTVVPFASPGVDVLIDITRLGLDRVFTDGDSVSLGSTARLAALVRPEVRSAVPVLGRAVRMVGSPLLRNAATVGGTLIGVFLPSDIGITLLALGAEVHLSGEVERRVALRDLLGEGWFSGYDLITGIRVPKRSPGAGAGFAKFGRSRVDIGLVNAAAAVTVSGRTLDALTVAVGQTGSRPALFSGQELGAAQGEASVSLVGEIARKASGAVKPKADYRASADFRRHLVEVMVARALSDAIEEAGVRLGD
jgi:carbon-monoxide dehydrogenase medium subunit